MLEEKNGSNENKNRKTKVTATEFRLQRKRFGQHSIEYRRRERHELSAQVSGNPSLFTSVPAKAGIDVGHGRRVRQDTSALRLPPYRGVSFPGPPARLLKTHGTCCTAALPARLNSEQAIPFPLPCRCGNAARQNQGGPGGIISPGGVRGGAPAAPACPLPLHPGHRPGCLSCLSCLFRL